MDAQFWLITIPTLVVFFTLAAALLVPIWRFLDREKEVSKQWTPEAVAERLEERDAAPSSDDEPTPDDKMAPDDEPARPQS
ncbi:MAG: hypothetical protein R6U20_10665 [Longimonas sp.]|uniref:hypothetical protein n=1 Tax=Longimonas sp. TaxID=2039626 RepID=UPI00397719B4